MYTDPMTEVYIFFYQSSLQIFVHLNLFLQRDDPIISVMSDQLQKFVKNLLGRFVAIQGIIDAQADTTRVQYKEKQLPSKCQCCINFGIIDNALHIGISTRSLLNGLLNEGDISSSDVAKFYKAVRCFYERAVEYSLTNLHLHDDILANSAFVNFDSRREATFDQVEFFIER